MSAVQWFFPLIPVALHCIRRRQLVGVSVETGQGIILISPAHWSRSLSSSAGIERSATKKATCRVEKFHMFWPSTLSVGDPAAKRQLPFRATALIIGFGRSGNRTQRFSINRYAKTVREPGPSIVLDTPPQTTMTSSKRSEWKLPLRGRITYRHCR